MGKKLTWQDVLESLPDHEKELYAQAHVDLVNEARYGSSERAKQMANELQEWEVTRWKLAKVNVAASKTKLLGVE
jgi:hypothetical protein